MAQTQMQMIQCPKCGATLPAWAQACQFCNASLAGIARPAGVKMHAGFDNRLSWQEIAYIAVSILMIILGTYNFIAGMGWISISGGGAIIGIWGAITALLGVALLAQQVWAQFLMKLNCILNVMWACLTLFMGLLFAGGKSDLSHGVAVFLLVKSVFELALNGFMLYLLHAVGDVDF